MQVLYGADTIFREWEEAVGCIGTFDGVHIGHQSVIKETVHRARDLNLPSILVTFDRHPMATLRPENCPCSIASLSSNLSYFADIGISIAVILPFDHHLAQTPATEFFEQILRQKLGMTQMVIGHDFAFGKGREGDPEWLAQKIPTKMMPPLLMEGHRISSSLIRKAIEEGEIERANRWLGHAFELGGVVVKGKQIGRTLGYPTANIARALHQCVPSNGVYAADAITPFGTFRSAVGVGVRPTVEINGARSIEAYLIDFPGENLYGEFISLKFLKKIRDEQKFSSLEALKEKMNQDVQFSRELSL